MNAPHPKVNVDILVQRDGEILLGLLAEKWAGKEDVYGLPGRDILFGETIGGAVKRNVREEFGCNVLGYEVIAVNANYESGNHYIGIGVVAEIQGELQHLLKEDWKEWTWFPLDELPRTLFAPAKHLIECFKQKKICVSE